MRKITAAALMFFLIFVVFLAYYISSPTPQYSISALEADENSLILALSVRNPYTRKISVDRVEVRWEDSLLLSQEVGPLPPKAERTFTFRVPIKKDLRYEFLISAKYFLRATRSTLFKFSLGSPEFQWSVSFQDSTVPYVSIPATVKNVGEIPLMNVYIEVTCDGISSKSPTVMVDPGEEKLLFVNLEFPGGGEYECTARIRGLNIPDTPQTSLSAHLRIAD